jgi:hypothetical protein
MAKAWRYKPANRRSDLPKEARALGRRAMDDFLLSPQLLKPVMAATKDIKDAAEALTVAEGKVKSGDFLRGFDSAVGEIVEVSGNPRVTGRVFNDSEHAAAVELGNQRAGQGSHILLRAGQPWHTRKGIA